MFAERRAFGADPGVKIRRLAKGDVPTVCGILQDSPEAAEWSRETLLESASIESAAWVAERDGIVVGFLIGRVAADEIEILNMAVSPAYRRNGIASKLLGFALEFSRTAGCSRAYLEVRASNPWAIGLYARHGFTECGRRRRYYRDPDDDALILSLRVDERI
jgi:ribosomal-protein-alanine N-acetyltransferase